jgi:hypothetical protein
MPSSPTCCAGHPATAAHSTTPLRRPTARRRARRACRIVYQLRTGVPWRLLPLASSAARPPAGGGCATGSAPGLAASAPPAARSARPRRQARLVQSLPGLAQRARQTGGELTGPNPTDRGKPGSKYHLLVDRGGIPLAVGLSAANTHDSMLLEPMVDAVPPVKGPRGCPGRPRRRPANDLVRDCSGWPRHRLASTRMKGPRG